MSLFRLRHGTRSRGSQHISNILQSVKLTKLLTESAGQDEARSGGATTRHRDGIIVEHTEDILGIIDGVEHHEHTTESEEGINKNPAP